MAEIVVLPGSLDPDLSREVAAALGSVLGDLKGKVTYAKPPELFADDEPHIMRDRPVKGKITVPVSSTSKPFGHSHLELLGMIDLCKQGGAAQIMAVSPHFQGGRSDKRDGQEATLARVAINNIAMAGADMLLCVQLHCPGMEAFAPIPVYNLSPLPLLTARLRPLVSTDAVVVGLDLGHAKAADALSQGLDIPLALFRKRRHRCGAAEMIGLVGEVDGRRAIVVDDIISTGGTLMRAFEILRLHGATGKAIVAATHPVLAGDAIARLNDLPISDLIVSNTVHISEEKRSQLRPDIRLHQFSVAPLLASTILDLLGISAPSDLDEQPATAKLPCLKTNGHVRYAQRMLAVPNRAPTPAASTPEIWLG